LLLLHAEYQSLFVAQDFGAKQRFLELINTGEIESVIWKIEVKELFKLSVLVAKYFVAVRSSIDRNLRKFFFLDHPADQNPFTILSDEIKPFLLSYYEARKETALYNNLARDPVFGLEKDPLFCVFFFVFRELFDNMKPRSEISDERHVSISLPDPTKRRIVITQRVSPEYTKEDPFAGAQRAPSIDRLNRRFGRSGLKVAEVVSNIPTTDERHWRVFEQQIEFLKG
jgi:hypothetical protein